MVGMKFVTCWNRKATRGEVNNGKYCVEIGTYMPSDKLIMSFINAGQIVAGERKVAYDFPDGVEKDIPLSPDRIKNYDMADASSQLMEINARGEAAMKEKESTKVDTKQKSSEVPDNGTKPDSPTTEKTE